MIRKLVCGACLVNRSWLAERSADTPFNIADFLPNDIHPGLAFTRNRRPPKFKTPKTNAMDLRPMKKSYKIITATNSTTLSLSNRNTCHHSAPSLNTSSLADQGEQPLTGLDIGNPVEGFSFALVYEKPLDEQALIEGLRKSLGRIPYFSGRLFGVGSSLPLAIPNNEGALFISALFDGHLPTFNPQRPLKPYLRRFLPVIEAFSFGHDTPLLQIQLTHFANGCILGISISHALCDGISMLGFVHEWANNVRGGDLLPLPCWNRREVQQLALGCGGQPSSQNPVVELKEPFCLPDCAVETGVFHLPVGLLQELERRYRADDDSVSRHDIITAFIYLLMAHCGANPEVAPSLTIACNLRRTLELSANYLGNAVWLRSCAMEHEHLQTADIEGIAGRICQLHRDITRDAIREDLAFWQARMADGSAARFLSQATHDVLSGGILIDNMSRFDFYSLDFGAGAPLWLDIPPPSLPAPVVRATLMMPTSSDRGGIDLHVILPPEEMERFRSQFDDPFLDPVQSNARFDVIPREHSPTDSALLADERTDDFTAHIGTMDRSNAQNEEHVIEGALVA